MLRRFIQHQSFGAKTPRRYQRRKMSRASTTVMDIPDARSLLNMVYQYVAGDRTSIKIPFAHVKVHPNEEFCRKKGIVEAMKVFTEKTFNILGVSTGGLPPDKDGGQLTRLVLVNKEGNLGIEIIMNPKTQFLRARAGGLQNDPETGPEVGEDCQCGCEGGCGGSCGG